MLRLINPALITPESYGLLPHFRPSPKVKEEHTSFRNLSLPILHETFVHVLLQARRNLTLITKVLQGLSNQQDFTEISLLPLNDYLHEKAQVLHDYFLDICEDPDASEGEFACCVWT